MDLIQYALNIFLPIISLFTILVSLPPYIIYRLFKYFTKLVTSPENLAGKVVLITGASSGIGEQIAYEYARRGASLSLAARREDRLRHVAAKSAELGSPEVMAFSADVSKEEDCKKLLDQTLTHFGRLDHLVNNAGVLQVRLFEDYTDFSSLRSLMDVNFWGSVYCTQFAIPHLRRSKGRIVVISSTVTWLTLPRLNVYNASKAAQLLFFETLKAEVGSDVGITIITPGVVRSEMIDDHFWSESNLQGVPAGSGMGCGRAIVESACRGEMYLTNPYWYIAVYWFKVLFPQPLVKFLHLALVKRPLTHSKKYS